MKRTFLSLFLLVGCGGPPELETPCGMIVTEQFDEIVLAESVAKNVLWVPFGEICETLRGVRINILKERTWYSASNGYVVTGEAEPKSKVVWLGSDWFRSATLFHELAHVLDWHVLKRIESNHETWEERKIREAEIDGMMWINFYRPPEP